MRHFRILSVLALTGAILAGCGDRETRDAGVRDGSKEGTDYGQESQGTGYGTPGTAGGTGTPAAGDGEVYIGESQATVTTEESLSAGATGPYRGYTPYGSGSAGVGVGASGTGVGGTRMDSAYRSDLPGFDTATADRSRPGTGGAMPGTGPGSP